MPTGSPPTATSPGTKPTADAGTSGALASAEPKAPSPACESVVAADSSAGSSQGQQASLADKLEGPKPKRSLRHLNRRDTEEQVDRIITTRFADFPSSSIDGKRIEGKTLREALLSERRSKKEKAGRIPQATIEKLRAAYASEDAPSRLLKPPAKKGETTSMDLVRALAHAHHSSPAKRSKQPLYAFFATTKEMNETETIGLLKSISSLAPSSSPSARRHMLEVMKFLVQCDLDIKFPDSCGVLRPRFDEALSLQWGEAKKGGERLSVWWSAYRGPARLAVDCKLVDRILEEHGSWGAVKSEIEKVTGSSALGRSMFWKAHGALLVEGFSKECDAAIGFLKGLSPMTAGMIQEQKDRLLKLSVDTQSSLSQEFVRRQVVVSYRGLGLHLEMVDMRDEIDFKFSAMCKEMSVSCKGGIPPFGPESFLLPVTPDQATKVPSELLGRFQHCRSSANSYLASLSVSTGKEMYEALKSRVATFSALDRTFGIEFAWLQSMMTEGGSQVLENKFLGLMPSLEQHPSLDAVLASVELLLQGDHYKFVTASAQGSSNTAHEILLDLKRGCFNPKSLKLSPGFLASFVDRVQYFCSFKPEGGGSMIYGSDAAEAHFRKWFASPSTEPQSLQDLEIISKFKYLLGQTQQDKLQQAIAGILKGSASSSLGSESGAGKGSAAPAAKRRKKSAAGAAKGKDEEADELEADLAAVMSWFQQGDED